MISQQGKKFLKYYPQHMILLSLLVVTLLGALLLSLPLARTKSIALIDLLFTSASLTTVTGLFTVPLDSFTPTGHIIMLILMQLGGLGLMTLSLVFMYLFTNFGVYTNVVAGEVLSLKNFKDTKRILFFMIKLTLVTESIGACLLFPTLYKLYPLKKAIFFSLFHAVSAFCNAGAVIFPNGLTQYISYPSIMLTTTLLMCIGGLGFVTWQEVIAKIFKKNNHTPLSWHTKLIFKIYGMTTLATGILFWLLERNNTLAKLPFFEKLYTIVFSAISMKSTGFELFPIHLFHTATLVLLMVCMFIGSAPLSTGSGIKLSVFAVYLAVIKAAIFGKRHAVLYGKHIADEQVYKAIAIIILSASWIIITLFCLLITESQSNFADILFETVSSFTNDGTTCGAVSLFSNLGKLFLMITMLVGRIGALVLVTSIKRTVETHELTFPKERIILG